MSLVAQSGAGALELQLVTVGISTSTRPGPSWYAVLECTCNLVCISSCVHFTLCSHTLLSQVASAVTTTAPRRHGLATASRTCQDKCCNAIVRALEGTLHDFEIWILGRIGRVGLIGRVGRIGRVGIIGRMTVPILTCFFFRM